MLRPVDVLCDLRANFCTVQECHLRAQATRDIGAAPQLSPAGEPFAFRRSQHASVTMSGKAVIKAAQVRPGPACRVFLGDAPPLRAL